MGVMAEYFMTENGIAWPEHIAPYTHSILVMQETHLETALTLAETLEAQGKTVIVDDRFGRNYGFGQKAGDVDLWGIPNRIIISDKTLEQGGYELLQRGQEVKIVKI